jgi:hypothetical protein
MEMGLSTKRIFSWPRNIAVIRLEILEKSQIHSFQRM